MASDSMEEEDRDDKMEGKCKTDDEEEDEEDGDADDDDKDEEGESGSEEDDDESEGDSDDDNDEESEGGDEAQRGEDGRTLSAYEVMRLERIKRNKEYLKKLGLDNTSSSSSKQTKPATLLSPFSERMLKAKREKKRKRLLESSSSTTTEKIERRTLSRRSRKQINYCEFTHPSSSTNDGDKPEKERKKKKRKERPPKSRMPRVIFKEFKRIEKERRKSLQESKRLLKASENEYKFSKRLAESFLKKQQREQQREQRKQFLEEQRNERRREQEILKPLWVQANLRQYETRLIVRKYDEWKDDCLKKHQEACHDLHDQMIETSNAFKACMNKAIKTLDDELLTQCGCSLVDRRKKKRKAPSNKTNPKKKSKKTKIEKEQFPAVPSSSNIDNTTTTTATTTALSVPNPLANVEEHPSSVINEQHDSSPLPPPPSIEQKQNATTTTAEEELLLHTKLLDDTATQLPDMTSSSIGPPPSLPQPSVPSEVDKFDTEEAPSNNITTEETIEPKKPTEPKQPKKLYARKVGGPITPEFSSQIKRSWLSSKDTPTLHNVHTFTEEGFIPQVNDIVLYYPSAHFDFLQSYPDIRAKKSRLKLRLPLWERASSNCGSSRKQSNKEQQSQQQKQQEEENNNSSQNHEDQLQKDNQNKNRKNMKWYTQKWIDQIKSSTQGGLGSYPILCRVEQTHAEFPFDHNASSVRKVKPKATVDQKTKQHNDDDDDDDEQTTKATQTKKKNKKKVKQEQDENGEDQTAAATVSATKEKKQKKKSKKSKQGNDENDKDQPRSSPKKTKRKSLKSKKGKDKTEQKRRRTTKSSKKIQQKEKNKPLQLLLELSVTLRPLTPILPPPSQDEEDDNDDEEDEVITALPPIFTVITFPTSKVPPFLVPFVWAYQFTQSLQIGNRVKFQFDKKGEWHEGTIHSFVSSSSTADSSSDATADDDKNVVVLDRQQQHANNPNRLECNMDFIATILSSAFNDNIPKREQLHHVASGLLHLTSTGTSTASGSTSRGAGGDASNQFKTIPKEELHPIIENILIYYYHHQEQQSTSPLHSEKNGISLGKKKGTLDSMLFRLIRRTLPLWDGVTVLWDDKSVCNISPWELIHIPSSSSSTSNPDSMSSSLTLPQQDALPINTLHEPLREKIENALKHYTKTKPQASIFIPPVTNSIAPSYFCFVPFGMCFRKILKRLKTHSLVLSSSCFDSDAVKENVSNNKVSRRSASKRSTSSTYTSQACYYRSVGALLSDVMDIFHCCIAYNDPSSQLVLQAKMVVEEVKSLILDLDHEYTKEFSFRDKEEGRKQMIVLSGALGVSSVATSKGGLKSGGRKGGKCRVKAPPPLGTGIPFQAKLCSKWAQSVHPDGLWDAKVPNSAVLTMSVEAEVEKMKIASSEVDSRCIWVPQSGDKILYSPILHRQFIAGHQADLREEQILLPSAIPSSLVSSGKEDQTEKESLHWLVGTIVSVKAVFPFNPPALTPSESTFEQLSPILALGIKLHYDWTLDQTHFIYWRHCVLSPASTEEFKQDTAPKCNCCGLLLSSSFLRPAWRDIPLSDQDILAPSAPSDLPYQIQPNGVPESSRTSISRCLDLLKRRCINGVQPDLSDMIYAHRTTNDIDINLQMLSLKNESENELTTPHNNDTAVQQAQMRLSKLHFLPPWLSSAPPREMNATTQSKISSTRKRSMTERSSLDILPTLETQEQVLPLPFLCLELVRCRLNAGYYRQVNSLINDIQEAYLSSVLFVCAEGCDDDKEKSKNDLTKFMKKIAPLVRQNEPEDTSSTLEKATNSPPPVADSSVETGGILNNSGDLPLIPTDKEISILSRIKIIRDLYATALICVLQPLLTEKVFTNPYIRQKRDLAQKRIKQILEEQRRDSVREKVFLLLNALGRDFCAIRCPLLGYDLGPTVRIKIVLKDELSNIKGEVKYAVANDNNAMAGNSFTGPEYEGSTKDQKGVNLTCEKAPDAARTHTAEEFGINTIEESSTNADASNIDERPNNDEESEHERSAFEKVSDAPEAQLGMITKTEHAETCKNGIDNTHDAEISTDEKNFGAAIAQSSDNAMVDLSQPIKFDSSDYLNDEGLTKALFGVDDRRDLCTRCKMSKKSFFFCRIYKAHSNSDFDWINCLEEPGGINGLLQQMLPSAFPQYSNPSSIGIGSSVKSSCATFVSNEHDVAIASQFAPGACEGQAIKSDNQSSKPIAIGNSNDELGDVKSSPAATSATPSIVASSPLAIATSSLQAGTTKTPSTVSQKDTSDPIIVANPEPSAKSTNYDAANNRETIEQKSEQAGAKAIISDPCPLRVLAIAERVLQMAKDAHTLAEKEFNSRPILSEDFIQQNFPIDVVDGHYEYCTVCGLSGDIMCCESCPNVSHPRCVGLNQVPEDDWFCKKCLESKLEPSCQTFDENEQSKEYKYGDHKTDDTAQEVKQNEEKVKKAMLQRTTNLAIDHATETWERKLKHLESCNALEELVVGLRFIRLRGKVKEKDANKAKGNEDTKTEKKLPNESADSLKSEGHKEDDEVAAVDQVKESLSNEEVVSQDIQPHGGKEEKEEDGIFNEEKVTDDNLSLEDFNLKTTNVFKFSLGTEIKKTFQEYGEFEGVVTRIPTNEEPFYRVQYEDGDEEDMSEDEIEKYVKTTAESMTKKKNPKRKRGRPRKVQIHTTGEQTTGRSPKAGPTPTRKRNSPKR